MNITWAVIIELAQNMFEINQKAVASYLGISSTSISRLKNGKYSSIKRYNEDIYKSLFDPTNKYCPAYPKDPKELLDILKEVIKNMGLTDATKNLPDNDYKKYVMGLLRLAENNKIKPSKQQIEVPHNTAEITENKTKTSKVQPLPMLDEFRHSHESYNVGVFIDINPINPFPAVHIRDAISFVGHIKYKHKLGDSPDKNEVIYNDIIDFTDALEKYIKHLMKFTNKEDYHYGNYPPKYEPLNSDDTKFNEVNDNYRKQLKTLYQKINAEFEKEKEERRKKRHSDFEKVLKENAIRGTLYE